MTGTIAKYLRSDDRNLDPSIARTREIAILLGVSPDAIAALRAVNIETVFDLAASRLFAEASRLVDAAERPESDIARAGTAPLDLVDQDARSVPVSELQLRPISVLRLVTTAAGTQLSQALGVATIRDLALWPPYHFARAVVSAALGSTDDIGGDPERPLDLLPATGRYPSERVQYEVMLLDRFQESTWRPRPDGEPGRPPRPQEAVAIENAGPIDVSAVAAPDAGFQQVAIGALLTFTQSWYTLGLALGQLLHALALAPGESTRLAVIDWRRRERGQVSQSVTETEALTSVLERNRSIAEVTSAVAHELQTGESLTTAESMAGSVGQASGGALQADGSILGIRLSGGVTGGQSAGFSTGRSRGWSWASSAGTRDIRAEMTQQINDTTHQASNLTRNRWATAVREVSQSEYEQLSTRTVANYNHMHALTIQYYEVVQLYRTVVELARVTRCLFIPMQLVDFRQPSVVARYRRVIGAAGLNVRVRTLLVAEPNALVVSAPQRAEPWSDYVLRVGRAYVGEDIGTPTSPALFYPLEGRMFGLTVLDFSDRDAPFISAIFESRDGTTREVNFRQRDPLDVDPYGGLRILGTDLFPIPQSSDPQVILEARRNASESFLRVSRVILKKQPGQENFAGRIGISMALNLVEGQPIQIVAGSDVDVPFMRISAVIDVPADGTTVVAFDLAHTLGSQELVEHLQENQLYYSQAVWRSLDAAMLAVLLSPYTFGGRPLFQSIDPVPVAIAGNYLVFRTYAEDPSWATFLRDKGLQTGRVSETIVPLPSGGVFAEAVLGRSNSAEKLDITRFWNWQDSPIPLQAPEIAALQAGSRAQPVDLTPGQLSAPVLNIVNPPALPDPQGMAAVLAAIQNGNMFRDMSGLAATIGLTQAALERGFEGARDAAAQAGQNAATAAQLLNALSRSGAASQRSTQSPNTISNAGARINHGADMDDRRAGAPALGDGDGTSVPGTSAAMPNTSNTSLEEEAFRNELGTGGSGLPEPYGAQSAIGAAGSGTPIGPALQNEIANLPRLQQAYSDMQSQGWSLRRRDLGAGRFVSVDTRAQVAYIDALDVTTNTALLWATEAILAAYREDDDLRRAATLDQARALFADSAATELERMARVCEWAQFHWGNNTSGLLTDMLIVLADGTPYVPSVPLRSPYYLWRGVSVLNQPDSTGFRRPYRQSGNQVRHTAGSLYTSYIFGEPGYRAAQATESEPSDRRLNQACLAIADGLKAGGSGWAPQDIGTILRRELGDPSETRPWIGADPNLPPPP